MNSLFSACFILEGIVNYYSVHASSTMTSRARHAVRTLTCMYVSV